MKKLVDILPNEHLDTLPASIFYVEEKDVTIKVANLHYAQSEIYNTKKMRCYSYYKPAIL